MAKKKTEAEQAFSLEAKLKEIREILNKMQLGVNDFDENIKLFTQGNSLIKECRDYLDKAELSVRQLVEGKDGLEEQDFD
jgi:exodeoxyribonuclease VII small subunit